MKKEEREKRWANGDSYNCYITKELSSFRKDAWKKQICSHFKGRTGLEILDLGTGPGFFACILSEEGHHVTAIDSSQGMLGHAAENARRLGVSPDFLKMDIGNLEFADDTFDVIVTRNVTWTLEHPEMVYTELKRILKPQGMLLIYDANWHLHFYDAERMKRVRERERRHLEKYGTREVVSGGDLAYFASAPLTRIIRPDWDVKVLGDRLGMEVTVHEDVGKEVYEQWEKELYGESPLFEICAVKPEKCQAEQNMKTYWQERAKSFGFGRNGSILKELGEQAGRYLPEGTLKVLDAGTGTGIVAASMALLGHEVTGIDLCSNMIEKARKNTQALGLSVDFVCTPAGELPFEENTFDVVISRNLLWALPDPEAVLLQWKRVLKPGGILAYWDGNHYLYLFDKEAEGYRKKLEELAGSAHGNGHADPVDYSLCDNTALELPLSKMNRPGEWDERVLPKLGFDIFAEEIERPQVLLKYGIIEGSYTNFFIAARNGKPVK